MKNNNKGFSLLELIVSFAILGIVSGIIMSMVTTSSNTYKSVTSDVNLQYESQLTMSQLQEYIVDCNGGICFDDNKLYLLNTNGTGYVAHIFRFDNTDGRMYYAREPVVIDESAGTATCDVPSGDFMAGYITDFDVQLSATDSLTTAVVNITFSVGGGEYTATQTTTLRNDVTIGTSFDTMLVSVCSG
ncbi:MAG TPA: hypothetical protein DIC60_02425 [Lachnospiraceae bacterium]|nr:hypothetical protein [Lachnospiraceae bacterium]